MGDVPTVEEVVAVLAKHANVSGDPDDQKLLSDYLAEEAEFRAQQEQPKTTTAKKGSA